MAQAPKRKLLIMLFENDVCKALHAAMWTLDLAANGFEAKLLLEGPGTAVLGWLPVAGAAIAVDKAGSCPSGGCSDVEGTKARIGRLLQEIIDKKLLGGVCKAASTGAGTAAKVPAGVLLDGCHGHASLVPFIKEGYEIISV